MFSKKSSTSQVARLHISLLIASFLIYLGGQIWQCVSWPPFYGFDETLEIDYVYQLSQGHLPTFFGGAEFNPLDLQYPYDVQWRYQHPPLFYLVQVPAFLLTDTLHHPIRGIWAMRFVETVLGILAIIASSWSARKVIGKPFAVTAMVPVIVASNRCFPSAVLNYTLASLWVILLIGMTASLIRTTPNGFSGKQLFVWSFLVALAPLTRTSTIPIMCLCGLMVIIHLVLSKCRTLRIWLTSVILPLLLAIVSSVWFYIRLYRLSGSFTGTQPEWSSTHLGRNTHLNFTQALFDKDFYISSFAQYQNSSVTGLRYGWLLVIALTFLPLFFGFVACIVTLFKKRHFRQTFQSDASIFIMLVLALAGTTFQQLLFFKQGGNPNAVYFSLISIVFALFIAYGFSLFPRWWAAALSIWLALRGFAFALEIHIRWPFSSEGTMAGASQYWVWLTLAGIITVCLGTFIAIIASAKGRKFSPLPLTAFGIATE